MLLFLMNTISNLICNWVKHSIIVRIGFLVSIACWYISYIQNQREVCDHPVDFHFWPSYGFQFVSILLMLILRFIQYLNYVVYLFADFSVIQYMLLYLELVTYYYRCHFIFAKCQQQNMYDLLKHPPRSKPPFRSIFYIYIHYYITTFCAHIICGDHFCCG